MRRQRTPRDLPSLELGPRSLKVLWGERGLEVAVARDARGRISPESRTEVADQLRAFFGGSGTKRRATAHCAISARGVTLRSLNIPPVNAAESERLLALQVEREFPIGLDQLAWGFRVTGTNGVHGGDLRNGASTNGVGEGPPRATLVALRREVIEEYRSLFAECGLDVTFGLGALATSRSVPTSHGVICVIDVGRVHTEVLRRDAGEPVSVRTVAWGGDRVTEAIMRSVSDWDYDRAERAKIAWSAGQDEASAGRGANGDDATSTAISVCVQSELESFTRLIQESWLATHERGVEPTVPEAIYLAGEGSRLVGLPERLRQLFGGVRCERIGSDEAATGASPATVALREAPPTIALNAGVVDEPEADASQRRGGLWIWGSVAAVLAILAITLPLLGPAMRMPGAEAELAAARAELATVPTVTAELKFLDRLHTLQLPVLLALHDAVAAAPGNFRFRELSLDGSGSFMLRGVVGKREQVYALSQKFIDLGWFSRVEIPDLEPVKNGSGVAFRITARVTKLSDRVPVHIGEKADDGSVSIEESRPAPKSVPVPESEPSVDPADVVGPPNPEGEANKPVAEEGSSDIAAESEGDAEEPESAPAGLSSGIRLLDGNGISIDGSTIILPGNFDNDAEREALERALRDAMNAGGGR